MSRIYPHTNPAFINSNNPLITSVWNFDGTTTPSFTDLVSTTTLSNVGGKLRVTPNNSSSYIRFDSFDTGWKNVDITIYINVVTTSTIGASTGGPRFTLQSTSPYSPGTTGTIGFGLRCNTTGDGSPYLSYHDGTTFNSTAQVGGTELNIVDGDLIKCEYMVRHNYHRITVTNQRNGKKAQLGKGFNSSDNLSGNMPPSWKLGLYGGDLTTHDINSILVQPRVTTSNRTVVIGDSITAKSLSSTWANAYAHHLITGITHAEVYGFPSYTSTNIDPYINALQAAGFQYAFLLIGQNDARGNGGATLSSYQTSYASIGAKLKSYGITVIHGTILQNTEASGNPTYNNNTISINTWLNSTYAADKIVDTRSLLTAPGDFNADGLHPNDSGHLKLYTGILAAAPELVW